MFIFVEMICLRGLIIPELMQWQHFSAAAGVEGKVMMCIFAKSRGISFGFSLTFN